MFPLSPARIWPGPAPSPPTAPPDTPQHTPHLHAGLQRCAEAVDFAALGRAAAAIPVIAEVQNFGGIEAAGCQERGAALCLQARLGGGRACQCWLHPRVDSQNLEQHTPVVAVVGLQKDGALAGGVEAWWRVQRAYMRARGGACVCERDGARGEGGEAGGHIEEQYCCWRAGRETETQHIYPRSRSSSPLPTPPSHTTQSPPTFVHPEQRRHKLEALHIELRCPVHHVHTLGAPSAVQNVVGWNGQHYAARDFCDWLATAGSASAAVGGRGLLSCGRERCCLAGDRLTVVACWLVLTAGR